MPPTPMPPPATELYFDGIRLICWNQDDDLVGPSSSRTNARIRSASLKLRCYDGAADLAVFSDAVTTVLRERT
jgi:hypothetical protein